MKEKLAQLVNIFADENGLKIKKFKEVDELENEASGIIRLYSLEKEYSKDNIAEVLGLWLAREKGENLIRFDCYALEFLDVIYSNLIRSLRTLFPEVHVRLINRRTYTTIYDSKW